MVYCVDDMYQVLEGWRISDGIMESGRNATESESNGGFDGDCAFSHWLCSVSHFIDYNARYNKDCTINEGCGANQSVVASRIFCLWAIADLSPQVYGHWGFTMMVTSWSLVEVPRYLFYAVNLIGTVPSPLFFLRYHLFMVLYPTGVLGMTAQHLSPLLTHIIRRSYMHDYGTFIPNFNWRT